MGGVTVISPPVVKFAHGVTVVAMPNANLTAMLVGFGAPSPTPGTGSQSTPRPFC
jgi:hypothetical protein